MRHDLALRRCPAIVAIAIASIAVLAPAPVAACSCAGDYGAYAQWPEDNATDVPIDTPLIIDHPSLRGSVDAVGYKLVDAAGKEVLLTETSRLPAAYQGCGQAELLFLRPQRPLEPNQRYTLVNVSSPGGFDKSFKTGEGRFSPEATIDAKVTCFQVKPTKKCSGPQCSSIAETYVDLGAKPTAPRWLVIDSAAVEDGHNEVQFSPNDTRVGSGWQLAVALPTDDPCIHVRVYGLEGTPLFETRRCEPDSCSRSDLRAFDSCGGPPTSGLDALGRQVGTCDDPALPDDAGQGMNDPATADAGSVAAANLGADAGRPAVRIGGRDAGKGAAGNVGGGGCSVGGQSPTTAWPWSAVLAILAMVSRCRSFRDERRRIARINAPPVCQRPARSSSGALGSARRKTCSTFALWVDAPNRPCS